MEESQYPPAHAEQHGAQPGSGGADLLAVLDGFLLFFLPARPRDRCAMACCGTGGSCGGHRLADPPVAGEPGADPWPWFLDELMRTWACSWACWSQGTARESPTFLDPGAFLQTGMKSAAVLWTTYQAHTGLTQVFTAIPYLLAWVGLLCGVCGDGLQSLLVAGRVAAGRGRGLCLLPCLMLRQTRLWPRACSPMRPTPLPASCSGPCWPGLMWQHLDIFAVSPVLSRRRSGRTRGHAGGQCGGGHGLDSRRLLSGREQVGRHAHQWHSRHGRGAEYRAPWPAPSATGRPRSPQPGQRGAVGGGAGRRGARAGVQAIAGLHSGGLTSLQGSGAGDLCRRPGRGARPEPGAPHDMMRGADPTRLMGVAAPSSRWVN